MGPLSKALFKITMMSEANRPRAKESLRLNKLSDLYRGLNLPLSVI